MAEVIAYEALVASWVMTRFQVALSGRGLTGSENPQSNKPIEGQDDAMKKSAELWVVADQIGLPVVGLSPWPLETYPLATNAQHLAAHLVYGISTAVRYSAIRRTL